MSGNKLIEQWTSFQTEFAARSQRLAAEYASAWADMQAALSALEALYRGSTQEAQVSAGMEPLDLLFRQQRLSWIAEPAAQLRTRRPQQRVLGALQDFESGREDLLRGLPRNTTVSSLDLLEMAGPRAAQSWRGRWLKWRGRERTLPMRDLLWDRMLRQSLRRSPADGAFQLLLAKATVLLAFPWQSRLRHHLESITSGSGDLEGFEKERQWWLRQVRDLYAHAGPVLATCRELANNAPGELQAVLLKNRHPNPKRWPAWRQRRDRHLSFWSRQQRACTALVHVQLAIAELGADCAGGIETSIASLRGEQEALLAELDSVIAWLDVEHALDHTEPFPAPQANLVSPEDRFSEWMSRTESLARSRLPATAELCQPERTLPGWRSKWRQIEPERTFVRFLDAAGAPAAIAAFREAVASHQPIVREIERAREVVAFGQEEARKQGTPHTIEQEAFRNALALLQYQRTSAVDPGTALEANLSKAVASVFLSTQLDLERSWLGLVAHFTRESGGRAAREIGVLLARHIRRVSSRVWKVIGRAYQSLLVKVGWLPSPPSRRVPVELTPRLQTALDVNIGVRDLPMIYRRLFRLSPVEDPRFLIGREREMAGLADARRRWDQGMGAAAVVVGERGSGKTSLLNCAVARIFPDVPVVSGQFSQRITTAAQLHEFLRGLFHIPDGHGLVETLVASRRVIILEEFERIFLRRLDGFGALEEFLRILDQTTRNNLWIVSANDTAFRYLSACSRLREYFTARINATHVSPDALTAAILQRHNLSGLRLQFAPPPSGRHAPSVLREMLGLVREAQEEFFSALYEQSEGIFRSSFELWQDCIERVDAGVVHTRQPLKPDYGALFGELRLDDHFALQAILQHGGLLPEELAAVLRVDAEAGRRRIKHLRDLDIIEVDPSAPGYRVRPQAGRFVRQALHAKNLLPGGES